MSILSTLAVLSPAHAFDPIDELPKKIFLEDIAPLHRPPGKEGPAQQLIRDYVAKARANPAWKGRKIEILEDDFGNLVVRVPGTGQFSNSSKWIAVQSHLDMVSLGEGIENGVDVVETNGRMHSRDHKTTLGADNGFGVAMSLALLRDPSIEHPPLELVFTLSEEIGLKGVQAFDIPLRSSCMINLDSEEEGAVVYACIGSRRTIVERQVEIADAPENLENLEFEITDLPAGHSGVQIHEPRPNAAVHGGRILRRLLISDGEVNIASLDVGTPHQLNAIPGNFKATLLLPESAIERVKAQAQNLFAGFKENTPGAEKARLRITPSAQKFRHMLTHASALRLASFLGIMPNGILVSDPEHPFDWRTSSNLGWVEQVGQAFRFGWMIRSWDNDEAELTEKELNRFVDDNLATTLGVRSDVISVTPAWRTDPNSWLFRLVERIAPGIRKIAVPGGLELAYFPQKYPTLEAALALGPNIYDPHSPQESAESDSLARTFNLLRRILFEMGTCEGNLSSPPDL